MSRGQDASRRAPQREIMLQTLNPSVMESIPSANFDLLADSVSGSQWPTLPLSPTRGHARGGSCSFLDGSPTRDGMGHLAESLETLPRGTSHRLAGPVESEFDLLGASSFMPTETPLMEPALEHAADAHPATCRQNVTSQHKQAPVAHRTQSITLPQPPEPSGTLPNSPASSLLLSSEGGTDAHTATQYTCSAKSKQCEPSSTSAAPAAPATSLRSAASRVAQPNSSARAQAPFGPPAEAMAAPMQQRGGRDAADTGRSPVSDATVVSASSQSSPPWMSSAAPASEHPFGILAPQRHSAAAHSRHSSFKGLEDGSNMNFQSCMSSMISSSMMSMDENSGKGPSASQPLGLRKACPPFAALDKPASGVACAAADTDAAPVILGAANQWSNPIYRSRSVNTDILDTLGSQPAASGPVSSFQECAAADEVSENDQNPTNDTSRHQSQTLESQALESSQDPTVAGDSGVVPDAICSILEQIDDMEKRISFGWQEEQARRATEEASMEEVAVVQNLLLPERSSSAAALSPKQLSARSAVPSLHRSTLSAGKAPQSPGDLQIRMEDTDAAMGSDSQATVPLSAREAWSNAQEPLSPSVLASDTPRNWEEHALDLQEQLAAAQLQAQLDREALEAQLRESQAQLPQERAQRCSQSPAARDSAGGVVQPTVAPNSSANGEGEPAATAPSADDASALVAEAQDSVKRLEEVVSTRLEPLFSHIAGMKRRMLSAQEEAALLRTEVQTAERHQQELEAKLEDMQKENKDDQDTLVAAWASRAQTKIPHPSPRQATDSSAPAVRTPRAHTSEEDVNALLKQLQAANAENAKLAEVVAGLQERQASLQALVDDRTSDTGSVPMSEHQQVVSQNKQLQAQLQQLRMDLELLYMDDQYATGANEGASMGIGASADGLSAGGPTSFMSTVHRLGALLGVSETQRASHSTMTMRRSVMNTLPQLNENGHLGSPESASPPHAAQLRKHSMNGTLPGVAEDSRLLSPPDDSRPVNATSPPSPRSPQAGPMGQDASMMDGTPNPGASVMSMSMLRSMDRGALTMLREHTADRLATTVQQQAGVLVEKDQQIAELQQRVRELEAPQVQPTADENMGTGSADAGQDDGQAWESLPPPESFKEALEQILMLQVENSRLSSKLAGRLDLPGSSGVLTVGVGHEDSRPAGASASNVADAGCSITIKQEKDRQKKGAALMKTVSQARKAMASINMLADAMTSVGQGRSGDTGAGGAPGETAALVDGASSKMPAEDGEWEVFKDMVTRALSDQVVAWQNAHTEVSRDLVAANLRLAEDAMLIEQLKADHDKLAARLKKMSLAQQQPATREPPTPSTPSSSGKGGRLSFLGRLTTPRHS